MRSGYPRVVTQSQLQLAYSTHSSGVSPALAAVRNRALSLLFIVEGRIHPS